MTTTYELLGIGFGPAGIALASAFEDHFEASGGERLPILFLEKNPDASWQRGMLLRETDIQNHYFRDLATPRNPRSRFTFANYLKEKGRLFEFGELAFGASGGAVGRVEWSDYISWAAQNLSGYASYNQSVEKIEPVFENGRVPYIMVITRDRVYRTKRLVLCTGRKTNIPGLYADQLDERIFHSSRFMQGVGFFDPRAASHYTVIGSGQSAIEVLTYLHGHFPSSTMASIHRSIGFRQVDLSPFSNEIFHPEEVDFYHALRPEQKAKVLKEVKPTNYSSVDQEAADCLYRKVYEDMVEGRKRINFIKRANILSLEKREDKLHVKGEFEYTREKFSFATDGIILCTGYSEEAFPAALDPLKELLACSQDGSIQIERNYRVAPGPVLDASIYASGISEFQHGISDSTSFSMMALKAGRVFEAIMEEVAAVTASKLQYRGASMSGTTV